jgi:hypothetical protein
MNVGSTDRPGTNAVQNPVLQTARAPPNNRTGNLEIGPDRKIARILETPRPYPVSSVAKSWAMKGWN